MKNPSPRVWSKGRVRQLELVGDYHKNHCDECQLDRDHAHEEPDSRGWVGLLFGHSLTFLLAEHGDDDNCHHECQSHVGGKHGVGAIVGHVAEPGVETQALGFLLHGFSSGSGRHGVVQTFDMTKASSRIVTSKMLATPRRANTSSRCSSRSRLGQCIGTVSSSGG